MSLFQDPRTGAWHRVRDIIIAKTTQDSDQVDLVLLGEESVTVEVAVFKQVEQSLFLVPDETIRHKTWLNLRHVRSMKHHQSGGGMFISPGQPYPGSVEVIFNRRRLKVTDYMTEDAFAVMRDAWEELG